MSTFQASHIETNVQKAIVKKIQALNRLNLSENTGSNFFSTAKTLEPADDLNPLEYHLVRNTFCRLSVDIPAEGEEKNKVLFFSSYITPGSERYGKKTQANRHITFNKNPFTKDEPREDNGKVQKRHRSFGKRELKGKSPLATNKASTLVAHEGMLDQLKKKFGRKTTNLLSEDNILEE